MNLSDEMRRNQTIAFHELLLRMAGRLPDELMTTTRRCLVDADDLVKVAQAVVFAAIAGPVAMVEPDVRLLADLLRPGGDEHIRMLATVERCEDDGPLPYILAPVSPRELAEHPNGVPYCLDLTLRRGRPGAMDEVDLAAVEAVSKLVGVASAHTLRRSWRFPTVGAPSAPARRVYLVQVNDEVMLPDVTARLQDALIAAGEVHPQVEAFFDPEGLPSYQRLAHGIAELLWTAEPIVAAQATPRFETLSLGPGNSTGFDPARLLVDGDERGRVAAYLNAGVPVAAVTPRPRSKVTDPDAVAPETFRTDGRWIWNDAVSHYLRAYGIAPDPELLDRIRARGYRPAGATRVRHAAP